jgi:hypothetical protein
MLRSRVRVLGFILLVCMWPPAALLAQTHTHPQPHTPPDRAADTRADPRADDWVALGTRIHGGFGSSVALGIRIGLDALADLGVARGDVDVTLVDGPETRCPCIADGLLLATGATPGRATLHIDVAKAPPGVVGIVTVRHAKTKRSIRYTVLPSTRAQLDQWNHLEPAATLEAVMHAPAADLYLREILP